MLWVRSGECCKCGECCKGPIDGLPEQADGACPYLLAKNEAGERLCRIHDTVGTYWAMGCNVWPTQPSHVEHCPSCTYRFEWVN